MISMRRHSVAVFLATVLLAHWPWSAPGAQGLIELPECADSSDAVLLVEPVDGGLSLENALLGRRSTRRFSASPIAIRELSQILWAAQGLNDVASGGRTSPSAGGVYPLSLYVAAHDVEGVDPGIYRYRPGCHDLVRRMEGNFADDLFEMAQRQPWVRAARAVVIFVADPATVARKYPNYPRESTILEAGHISQNIYLQGVSLGLGVVAVGGFSRRALHEFLDLPEGEEVIYLNLLGHVAKQ